MFFLSKTYPYGFRFKQIYPHVEPFISQGLAGKPHLGDDLLAPIGTVGVATLFGNGFYEYGPQGGHQLYFYPSDRKVVIRFLHLKQKPKVGAIAPGDQVFVTGNSGAATNSPHLHVDIYDLTKGSLNLSKIDNFINPSSFDWKGGAMNQTKVVLGKDGKTVYECTPIALTLEEYKKQAGVEGIIVPDPIPHAADSL